ncbi:MAG: hypothetical protein ACTSUB_08315 [Candidatus Thorarchaeota archaeon]
MSRFFKKDPLERAKKHVAKALREIEADYVDYASMEYEKAAKLFNVVEQYDFGVKYFREAAYCALDKSDHIRAAEMKVYAAETLLIDKIYAEAGNFYSEASDHVFRMNKPNAAISYNSYAIMCNLAARSFDTAINLLNKAEERAEGLRNSTFDFAKLCVRILANGESMTPSDLKKTLSRIKDLSATAELIQFLSESVKIALETEVVIEWAGKPHQEVKVKTPIEFELRYKCPVPVRVINHRYELSNSLVFQKEPEIELRESENESWLLALNPVLSGDGTVGPFKLTLEGSKVLCVQHSNKIEFRIADAPASLKMNITPERVSCDLGEEVVFDIEIINEGLGSAGNIVIKKILSSGLEHSVGTDEKTIQFLGSHETMRFQVYVRGLGFGDELVTVILHYPKTGEEITKTAMVRVG